MIFIKTKSINIKQKHFYKPFTINFLNIFDISNDYTYIKYI